MPSALLEALKAIEGAIDRLNRLGIAIRESSVTSRAARTKGFMEASSYNSFKELAYTAVRTLYPDTNHSLQDLLSTSIAERYARILSRRSHQQKLQARRPKPRPGLQVVAEDVAMDGVDPGISMLLLEANAHVPITPRLVAAERQSRSLFSLESPSSANTQLVKARMDGSRRAGSRRSRASSVQIHRVNYPKPQQAVKGDKYLTCEWCFESHEKKLFDGDSWRV